MTTDLEGALRSTGADLHLSRPVTDVLARGDRLRQRRYAFRTGTAALCLAVAGGAAWVAAPSDSSSTTVTDPATTTPGVVTAPALVNLTPDQLAAADTACRSMARGGPFPATIDPAMTDTSNGTSVLFYRDADHYALCTLQRGQDGKEHPVSSNVGDWHPLPAGQHFGSYGFTFGSGLRGEPSPDAPGAFLVADDVARLVFHIAGQDVEARIGEGLAVVWLPAGVRQRDVTEASATAYAEDGTEVDSGSLLDQMAPPG